MNPANNEQKAPSGPRGNGAQLQLIEMIHKFEAHRVELGKSLVRVRLFYTLESKLPNGAAGPGTVFEQGAYLGIVIDALPVIAIPDTTGDPSRFSPTLAPNRDAQRPPGFTNGIKMEGPFYEAILASGKRARLVVSDHARPISWTFLQLADESDPPEELRHPLVVPEHPRRVAVREPYLATIFKNPLQLDTIVTIPGVLNSGSENFLRPALSSMAAAIGAPVFSVDGEWLGVVNHPPEGAPLETPRVGHVDASKVTAAEDPKTWSTGYRWPVLFSIGELVPEIERVARAASQPHQFDELGIALCDRGGKVSVTSVSDSIDMITTKPQVGDHVLSLGGMPTRSVAGFEKALEAALSGDAKSAEIVFERNGESYVATLRFPG